MGPRPALECRPPSRRGGHMTHPVRLGGESNMERTPNRFRGDWLALAAGFAAVTGLAVAAWVCIRLA
jgi:hypothetical protein